MNNPVAKHARTFNKAHVHRDRTKYHRSDRVNYLESLDDLPEVPHRTTWHINHQSLTQEEREHLGKHGTLKGLKSYEDKMLKTNYTNKGM